MAVRAGVGLVEQLHRAQVDLAGLEREGDPVVELERGIHECREGIVDERFDHGIALAEETRVVGVRADALDAVDRHLHE